MLYLTGENRVCDDSDWSFEVTTDADIARAVSLGLVIQGVLLRDGVLHKEPVKKILTQEVLKLQALTGCVIDVDNGGWLRAIAVERDLHLNMSGICCGMLYTRFYTNNNLYFIIDNSFCRVSKDKIFGDKYSGATVTFNLDNVTDMSIRDAFFSTVNLVSGYFIDCSSINEIELTIYYKAILNNKDSLKSLPVRLLKFLSRLPIPDSILSEIDESIRYASNVRKRTGERVLLNNTSYAESLKNFSIYTKELGVFIDLLILYSKYSSDKDELLSYCISCVDDLR